MRDAAPRGGFRHPSGVWAIRYTCGGGHIHKEKVGLLKGDAIRAYHNRRARAHEQAGCCPAVEREQARAHADAASARERARISFTRFAEQQ